MGSYFHSQIHWSEPAHGEQMKHEDHTENTPNMERSTRNMNGKIDREKQDTHLCSAAAWASPACRGRGAPSKEQAEQVALRVEG